jgi:hypothetical protein
MSDPAYGHPASRLPRWRASAPPPLSITIAADVCLLVSVGALALVDAPSWSCLVAIVLAAPVFVVYGHRAAKALGISSRDQTPRGWLMIPIALSGPVGVLAANAGRYAGLIFVAYIALSQVGERIAWARWRMSR